MRRGEGPPEGGEVFSTRSGARGYGKVKPVGWNNSSITGRQMAFSVILEDPRMRACQGSRGLPRAICREMAVPHRESAVVKVGRIISRSHCPAVTPPTLPTTT